MSKYEFFEIFKWFYNGNLIFWVFNELFFKIAFIIKILTLQI